jgi:uncharacterized protein (TIGR02271 family)
MSDFFGLFGDDKSQNNENNTSSSQGMDTTMSSQQNQTEGSLQLHKEELDITKNNVDAGEVVLSKDVVEEQKTVDVPVMHEEVVIKRTPLNNEKSNDSISAEETIHIPVSQEQVQVNKYTVTTEEISAAKRQVEETQQVQETLKREEAHVNTTGSVDIISDDSGFQDINNS